MGEIQVLLFGMPHVNIDGRRTDLKSNKAMGLIAYLTVHRAPLSRERLSSIFWPASDQSVSSGSLRTTLWRLNKAGLGNLMSIERDSISINFSDDLYIDILQFEDLIQESIDHGHSPNIICNKCISILKDIIILYKNGFMRSYFINDSSEYEVWQVINQERMRFMFSNAISRLVNAFRIRGDTDQALNYAHHWLNIDPYHDEANRSLMQIYIDAGQRESALRHYEEYVHTLKRDLDISPDEALNRIYHQIKTGIQIPKFVKHGAIRGILFQVNISSISSPRESAQEFKLADLNAYADQLTGIITSYGGKILHLRPDSVTALFTDGNPLTCAAHIQRDHDLGSQKSPISTKPGIGMDVIEDDNLLELYDGTEIARLKRISQSTLEGQILITTRVLAKLDLPEDSQIIDLGSVTPNNIGEPIHLLQLTFNEHREVERRSDHVISGNLQNLPFERTAFVGREHEIGLISSLLESRDHPIISLIGPGGIGKTRLAKQVATQQADRFRDGVYFVSLKSRVNPELFFSELSDVLNFRLSDREKPENQVFDFLHGKQILLVLDNFENLIHGSSILADLVQQVHSLIIMVTSRERLNLSMEWAYEIQGLAYPAADPLDEYDTLKYSACKLFFLCAERVLPEFNPGHDQKKCIAEICRIVNGSPLAIELAAAWVRSLTCCEITEHIKANLDFLSGGMQDFPARHHSLRAVFESSWRLLSREEQMLLSRLSIFRGGFQKIAAEQIANASIQLLTDLVDRSMVHRHPDGRFEMPETIRFFADEILSSNPEERKHAIQNYCSYYGDFSQRNEATLIGPDQLSALEAVRHEIENINNAWSLALQTENYEVLKQLLNIVFLYSEIKCLYRDASEIFRNALEEIKQASHTDLDYLKMRLQLGLGWYYVHLGNYEEGLNLLEESLSITKENHLIIEKAFALNSLGDAYRKLGELDKASTYIKESIAIFAGEEPDSNPYLNFLFAQALHQQGALQLSYNQFDQARETLMKSSRIFENTGNIWWGARVYGSLGFVNSMLEDHLEAKRLREKNLEISRKIGDQRGTAVTLNNLASTLETLGETDRFFDLLAEALKISQSIGDRRFASIVMLNLADAYLKKNNDFFEAEKYFLESIDTFKAIGDKRGSVYALYNYACALLERGDFINARYYGRESLKFAIPLNEQSLLIYVLSGLARPFLEFGNSEISLELCEFVLNHPDFDLTQAEIVRQVVDDLNTQVSPTDNYEDTTG